MFTSTVPLNNDGMRKMFFGSKLSLGLIVSPNGCSSCVQPLQDVLRLLPEDNWNRIQHGATHFILKYLQTPEHW